MDVGGAVESPLDVLSRAATMVSAGATTGQGEHQKQQQHQSSGTADRGKTTSAAQLYLLVPLSVRSTTAPPRRAEVVQPAEDGATAPLDMRRRQRPTEEQPAPGHERQHQLRPSVITCAPSQSPADVMDDPDIDEHFRRSLGSDYVNVFSAPPPTSSRLHGATAPHSTNNNPPKVTGNSVDDHFAKALGDTWQWLQQRHEDRGGGDGKQWQQRQGEDKATD
ncbi:uncharacterized protein LOC124172902 isoform X2 [Ischnura elegans]|uniref:uncharacterized protein LOC124172902 isoform X2 n=1 Tax=Ischnura elegans TaxID=197161 RepID=UPI001ED86C6E|nr:uncharacterized protein LOC124172902 isoform X2 [Ischnura elegans]